MAVDEFRVCAPLRDLGHALQPLLRRLQFELTRPMAPTRPAADPTTILSQHLDRLSGSVQRLVRRVEDMEIDVAANPQAGEADVRRVVDGLTRCVDDLIDGCRDARSLRAGGAAADMPTLLAGAYLHLLGDIEQWLERMVRTLADPGAELARLRQASPPYEIELKLELTAAPQWAEIRQWAQQHAPQTRRIGFWDQLSALVLSWALVGALFGGGHDCN